MRNFTEDLRWAQDVQDGAIAGVLTADWQSLEHLSIRRSPAIFKPADIVYVGAPGQNPNPITLTLTLTLTLSPPS